ncbi:MAG: polyketide synthase dehydratase domain-containing protein, partial [Myxococcales bacterium]|nr:polyketide synthase dehydratase domain-containing protein [Myxococcales bacterium]
AMFESRGVGLIPLAEGAAAFVNELSSGDATELVIGAGLEINPRDDRGRRAEVRIDRHSAPQLDHHRVREQVVVPVVMVLEWFAALARLELPQASSWVIEDFRVLRGLVLEDFEQPTVTTVSAAARDDGSFELAVVDAQGGKRHAAILRSGPATLAGIGPATLAPSPWTVDQIYEPGKLFHGPAFQAIAELRGLSEAGASARLLGGATLDAERWGERPRIIDAAAVDGMLQLALLCGLPRFDGPSLPLSIARCELAADPGVGPYQCELRVRDGSAQHTRCDAVLIAADGRVVVRIEGLQMFALPRAAAAE